MDHVLSVKTAKYASLKNLYEYSTLCQIAEYKTVDMMLKQIRRAREQNNMS